MLKSERRRNDEIRMTDVAGVPRSRFGVRPRGVVRRSCFLVRVSVLWLAAACLVPAGEISAGDWPQFRGPGGQGRSDETGIAAEWSPTRNVAWKADVPGQGWSSPVVAGGRVYLTTAVQGPGHQGNDRSLRALCYDAMSGAKLWDVEIFEQKDAEVRPIHSKNSHASPTPVVDGEQVFVHFGPQGTAALSPDGEILWENQTLRYDPRHGNGGSPVLVGNLLVFSCDGADIDFVAALDRRTGRVRWRQARPPIPNQLPRKFSFSTPTAVEVGGRTQIVSPGTDQVLAYDPANGRMVWRVRYLGYSVIPCPVFVDGIVYVATGWERPSLLAIKPDGRGDVTGTHVVWKMERGVPHSASVLAVGNDLFFVSDQGVASCVEAAGGKVHWQQRIGGNYSASPVYADGKVYFPSEEGQTTVVKAGQEFEQLARNDLRERTLATPAIADGGMFLRTEKALYRIEER